MKLNEITRVRKREFGDYQEAWALHNDIYKYFSDINNKRDLLEKYKKMLRILKPGSARRALTFFYRIRRDEIDKVLNLHEYLNFERGDFKKSMNIGKNYQIPEILINRIQKDLDNKKLTWEYYEVIAPWSNLRISFTGKRKGFSNIDRHNLNDEEINSVEIDIRINDSQDDYFNFNEIDVKLEEIIPLVTQVFSEFREDINNWIRNSPISPRN